MMSAFPRDLLRAEFLSSTKLKEEGNDAEESVETEVELTLGLSTNGRFGLNPAAAKNLTRSSSIPDFLSPAAKELLPQASILRTCSLPVEAEEEVRKRKEIQSTRRLEAKRKRTEKQRSLKGSSCFSQGDQTAAKVLKWVPSPPQPLSQQRSIGSQGSGSSGVSESESLQLKGKTESGIPTIVHPMIESRGKPPRSYSRPLSLSNELGSTNMEMVRSVWENMPCVSTKGDGPDCKRIEGFLYRYRKGDEVRIVCVCHGSFLSPAEFVRHAGGGDVAHPLRHIVVNHSPL